jgi:putative CocE/NonD family hydrolase
LPGQVDVHLRIGPSGEILIYTNWLFRRTATLFIFSLFLLAPLVAAEPYTIKIERDVPVQMRDGVTLRADIYRPDAVGKFPILLQRTPYDKHGWGFEFARKAAMRGYVVVLQDVRGRYTSEGEWRPFIHEADDGYDTVEWAATLPFADGRVGMFGGSYVGATQMLAATAHPPHLAGICPVVTASNYHDGWTYQGGAFEQWFNESWTSGLAQDSLDREIRKFSNARRSENTLPLSSYPVFSLPTPASATTTSVLAPYFLDWLAHPNYDEYWKSIAIESRYSDIRVPALHIAAWYDIFLGGSLRNYVGLKSHAATAEARDGQRLLVIIGGHAGGPRHVGELDFGPQADQFDEGETTLSWYDFLFMGVQNEFANPKPVKIFVMGLNQWRSEDNWPLLRARPTKYFLHAPSPANSSKGAGVLSTSPPVDEPVDKFLYDPANPVPTVGGPLCCDSEHLAPGPFNQSAVELRDDVLVFSTAPLEHDIEVTGPVRLDFFASSSAVDTDFTAKLVDVFPNGSAINITEGILRASYRSSQESPTPLVPGQVYPLTIDLWATSNLFRSGHRIRLEISSSNFPRFDRNLNTGESAANSSKMAVATNSILHDHAHPSALILPVLP